MVRAVWAGTCRECGRRVVVRDDVPAAVLSGDARREIRCAGCGNIGTYHPETPDQREVSA